MCSSSYNSLWGIHSMSHHPLHPAFWSEAHKVIFQERFNLETIGNRHVLMFKQCEAVVIVYTG